MEVKRKEVVIMKDIFVACDGTEFEDEDDCIEHEFDIRRQKLACYDEEFDRVDIDSCDYVDATTEESLALFQEICRHYNYSRFGIEGVGLYWYEPKSDTWVNVSQIMSNFEKYKKKEVSEE